MSRGSSEKQGGVPWTGLLSLEMGDSPLGMEASGNSSLLAGLLEAASFGEVSTYQSSSPLSLALWFSARSVLLFLEKALLMWTGGKPQHWTATLLSRSWKNKGRARPHPPDTRFRRPHSDVCFLNRNRMFVTCSV